MLYVKCWHPCSHMVPRQYYEIAFHVQNTPYAVSPSQGQNLNIEAVAYREIGNPFARFPPQKNQNGRPKTNLSHFQKWKEKKRKKKEGPQIVFVHLQSSILALVQGFQIKLHPLPLDLAW